MTPRIQNKREYIILTHLSYGQTPPRVTVGNGMRMEDSPLTKRVAVGIPNRMASEWMEYLP